MPKSAYADTRAARFMAKSLIAPAGEAGHELPISSLYEYIMEASPSANLRPIACIGALHWDMVAHAQMDIRPDTSTPAHLSQGPGGVAANVARALARLGVPTHMIGAVGDDPAGAGLKLILEREGIGAHLTVCPGEVTGHYLALHNPDGSLPAACIDDRLLQGVDPQAFVAGLAAAQTDRDADIVFLDANLSSEQAQALIDAVCVESLVAADAVSAAKAARLHPLLPQINLLFTNRMEAASLTGLPPSSSPEGLLGALLDLECAAIMLTDGAEGLWFAEQGSVIHHVPSARVKVVDVTGAGDALIAGTLAGLNRGKLLEEATHCGLAAARLALQAKGSVPQSLTWSAIEATT